VDLDGVGSIPIIRPFMNIYNILLLSCIIFNVGVLGVLLNRRNIIILLMSFEIMYLAASINFGFYSFNYTDAMGVLFIIYVLTIVGAESCIGLSLIAVYYTVHKDISMNVMQSRRR
jgi:NADH:ubiquinone oxidoreductase subunit K